MVSLFLNSDANIAVQDFLASLCLNNSIQKCFHDNPDQLAETDISETAFLHNEYCGFIQAVHMHSVLCCLHLAEAALSRDTPRKAPLFQINGLNDAYYQISKEELAWGSRLTVSDQIHGQANMSKLVNTKRIKRIPPKASEHLSGTIISSAGTPSHILRCCSQQFKTSSWKS